MAKRKKVIRPRAGRAKARGWSASHALAVLAAGGVLAVALALYLGGGTAPATTPPDTLVLDGPPTGGHVRGASTAAVTLVEYGDYACPTCGQFHRIVSELMRRMPEDLKLEFHHYPLPVDANSVTAALAAQAAGEQGRYWEMHDALFENQSRWVGRGDAMAVFSSMAAEIGLDPDRFTADLLRPDVQSGVILDREQGERLGVRGTPTFFINNQRLEVLPQSLDQFEAIIRSLLVSPER